MATAAKALTVEDALDVGALYRDHAEMIGRVIFQLTGPGAHIEDLLQETFLTAHRTRHTFRGEAKPSTWLYSIARHLCLRHHRGGTRLGKFIQRFQVAPPEPQQSVEEALEKRDRHAIVHEVIRELSFKQREVFVLYEIEDLKGAQIAKMLGIPEATVWTRLTQARKNFEKKMSRRVERGEIS